MIRSIGRPVTGASLDAQARRLRKALVQLSRRRPIRDPIASACEDLDLTPAQLHIILWLGNDGPLTMGELARAVLVTEKTITGVVDRLERDLLVHRERDPADRRVVHVRLAPRGAALYRRIDEGIASKLAKLLGLLEAEDRKHLVRMVETLTAKLAAEET
ncbi:MAG TPA: MarR family transcriptional regulator [Longimicrobiales bacterium]